MSKKSFVHYLKSVAAMLVVTLLFSHRLAAQTTVSGKVTGDGSPAGIPGVTVNVKGTKNSTQTDSDGKFSVSVGKGKVLVFTYVGYLEKEVEINGQQMINVELAVDAKGLGEVVVVGYGSQLKKNVTGAVQTINAAELKDIPVSQMTQKLQGKLAGV